MKIDRPTIYTPPEPVQEHESTKSPGKVVDEKPAESVELQRKPSLKTDSVEIKEGSSVILDNVATKPKIDSSQVNLNKGNEVSAALIPGVPFREKVELPKTLPTGTSVDSGVGSGDLGFGKTRPGPNHMGIDLKAGGTEIRNQLDDALKLREGGGSQSSAPPAGTVNLTGLAGKPGTGSGGSSMIGPGKTQNTYDGGFSRPGMGLISADKDGKSVGDKVKDVVNAAVDYVRDVAIGKFGKLPGTGEAMTLLDAPSKVKEVTGDATDLLRGADAVINPEKRLDKILDDTKDEYVNPDAPEGTQPPVITDESLEKVGVRLGSRTQPGVEEHLQEIDGSMVSGTDPRRELISNPNSEDQSSVASTGNVQVILDAKGPDTVNPKDPEFGGGEPIVFDPKRPKP